MPDLYTIITAVMSGIFGGGIWQLIVNKFFDTKERKRLENVEIAKMYLQLLPLMRIAEHEYRMQLEQSIYLNDVDESFSNGYLPVITIDGPNKELVNKISGFDLHLLDDETSTFLANHEASFTVLRSRISERQSPINYQNALPEQLCSIAKDILDEGLADILLQVNKYRMIINRRYNGGSFDREKERNNRREIVNLSQKCRRSPSPSGRLSGAMRKYVSKIRHNWLIYRLKAEQKSIK